MTAHPVLAIDIGGTKTSMALVTDATILDLRSIKTRRSESADVWIAAIQESVTPWSGRYAAAGLALTGRIRDGRWHALNPATLPIPSGFPIIDRMSKALGVRVTALNGGQAAAWGEYRHGAGAGSDLVYLTVSTGIGGGIVLDGKLRTGRGGLAGHIGVCCVETLTGERLLEEIGSGSAMARLAAERGHFSDAIAVFAAAQQGQTWACELIGCAIAPAARAIRALQLMLDPDIFLIGGGVGLAHGYLDQLTAALEVVPAHLRPTIRAAALGANAGLVGIADFAQSQQRAPEAKR